MGKLKDKVAIVTGSSKGIGALKAGNLETSGSILPGAAMQDIKRRYGAPGNRRRWLTNLGLYNEDIRRRPRDPGDPRPRAAENNRISLSGACLR